jgi:hypothetical protein
MPPRHPPAPLALRALGGLGVAAVGYAYGALAAAIPSPDDPDVFWVGNLAAPFVVLPSLLVSWVARIRRDLRVPLSLVLGGLAGVDLAHVR